MKKQVNPVVTAVVILIALSAVLRVYKKGLLEEPKGAGDEMMGGGGGPPEAPPLEGLESVKVSTLAGWASPGLVDGSGWAAKFNGPAGIALAPNGSLYVSDSRNHRIRLVTKEGAVSTVAGAGPVDCLPGGYADGPANEARFSNPAGLCVGPDGAVYIADAGNHRIRKLHNGQVTTLAGGETPRDEFGFESGGHKDGPAAEAVFKYPVDVELTPSGELLIADSGNGAIRRLAGGVVTTEILPLTPSSTAPTAVLSASFAGADALVADPEAPRVLARRAGVWSVATAMTAHVPRRSTALALLPDGALLVTDGEWHTIFGVEPSGKSTLLAGSLPESGPHAGTVDGTGNNARFTVPCAVAAEGWTVYVADFGSNCIRKLEIPPNWNVPPPPPPDVPRWRRARGERQRELRRELGRDGDRSAR